MVDPEAHPLLPLLRSASKTRVAITFGVLALLFGAIWLIRDVATPVLTALGVAYILSPVVAALERRRVPRPVGVTALMVGVVVVLVGVIAIVVPAVVAQVSSLGARLPHYATVVVTWIDQTFHLAIPTDTSQALAQLKQAVTDLGPEAIGRAGQYVLDFLAGGAGALTKAVTLFLVPVFLFFFLVDWPSLTRGAMALLPRPMQGPIGAKLAQIDRSLSAYVRGVLTVASILAVIYSVALSVLGVPLGLLIGLMAGAAYVVPFLSPVIGITFGVAFSLLEFHGWSQVLGVVIVFVAGNVVESFVLTPRIVGDSLGLPPLAVILAVMIGGSLFGFLGVLLALPGAAVVNVVGRDLLALWKSSELYKTGLKASSPGGGA
ncbi:AI-2E family transporter [Myxococcota bacterium]|nr:AI-2E family transporter [Myxococcota bacterium]